MQPVGPLVDPPYNGVLLLRNVRPALPSEGGSDFFKAIEFWYNPLTRTADRYQPAATTNGAVYSKPITDLVASWCNSPGVAPYTQTQVYHNGLGGITLTSVDGVLACQIICTLTATLTATAVIAGQGQLTATATGATGPYLFSLDNFATAGRPPSPGGNQLVYPALSAGTYTVTVRETRPAGCVATATATLAPIYGARYEVDFMDVYDTPCMVRIFQRDYAGPVEILKAQPQPVVLDWPGGATSHVFTTLLRGSSCALALYLMRFDQLLPLFSGDERLFRVDYTRAGNLFWTGYLLPEQYDVAWLTPPATFNLAATDGLGSLSTIPFIGAAKDHLRGDRSLLSVILFCLNKLDLGLPLHTLVNLYPSAATLAASALEQASVDAGQYDDGKGTAYDCGKVLSDILTTFQARLYQENGSWWLERLSELSPGPLVYATYLPDGTRLADYTRTLLQTIVAPSAGTPHWLHAGQRQGLRAAVASVTVNVEPGTVANQLTACLPTNADLPGAVPTAWARSLVLPGGAAVSQLLYAGKDKPPTLRLFGVSPGPFSPLSGGWVELPPVGPLPLSDLFNQALVQDAQGLKLTFTATPYGETPATDNALQSKMYVALRFGAEALGSYGVGLNGLPAVQKMALAPVCFAKDGAVSVIMYWSSINFAGKGPRAPLPVYIRLYAPIGGASACTVDITDLNLAWMAAPTFSTNVDSSDAFTSIYRGSTGVRVSRVDKDTTLFHSDTPLVRRSGTLLGPGALPTTGWYEPGAAGQLREVGDYLVRDRMLFSRAPAQALTGTLRGGPTGPGALVTDPFETRPGVYLLTSALHNAQAATWEIGAVSLLPLLPPVVVVAPNAIYNEDLTAWLRESGPVITYETI